MRTRGASGRCFEMSTAALLASRGCAFDGSGARGSARATGIGTRSATPTRRPSRPCVEMGLGKGYLTPDEHAVYIVVHPRRVVAVIGEVVAIVALVLVFLVVLLIAAWMRGQ